MTLYWWLIILGGVLVVVRLFDAERRTGRANALSAIARTARMNYSAIDRFDLERRLQHSPDWTAGLTVRDILYGTRGEERLFVATLERRAAVDDRTKCYVIACAEPLDHSELRILSLPKSVKGATPLVNAYRAMVEGLAIKPAP